jgi:hypothetical protein
MHKGFGLYSPHEATSFFLKTMLVSFWVGVDLIAMLVMASFPGGTVAQHGTLIIATGTILIAGTVFSGLFAWATGALFARQPAVVPQPGWRQTLQQVQREPWQLLGAGALAVFILACALTGYVRSVQKEAGAGLRLGRADVALGAKCAEVARLEGSLFRSDEQFVMAQCLIQYDKQYVALLGSADTRRR